ncbi:hypothetical protein, partial [Pseudomonas aeruginosa]|uniref:hypothetical protein n=1 Tax=Pseudomonas aeruginosa TaxID=287 RepID=UPI002A4DE557|nr:hypothetical protein [Pseudomonas aeruginosa]MCT0326950.1 hypothetical protein [Pseudomonas aeruginosa]MCT0596405.1 hypothetical protein [Pseudomonas aeruginosa]
MTPHAFARWNLLLLVASIFAGLVFAPSADLSALPTPEARKWVLAEVPSVAVDTTVAGKLAGMSWWGCSGQPIPDSGLSFSSATAGGNPSLN